MSNNRKLTDFFKPSTQSNSGVTARNGRSIGKAVETNQNDLNAQGSKISLGNSTTQFTKPSGSSSNNNVRLESKNTGSREGSHHTEERKSDQQAKKDDAVGPQEKLQVRKTRGLEQDNLGSEDSDGNDVAHENQAVQKVVVIRSSDDEEDDSDSSLEDLDAILRRHKPTTSNQKANQQQKPQNVTGLLKLETQKKVALPKVPAKPIYSISMDDLVKSAEKDRTLDAKIESIRATAKVPMEDTDMKDDLESAKSGHLIDNTLLASVVGEDSEKGGVTKVVNAISRTEALNKDQVWYFFQKNERSESINRLPFPQIFSSEKDWKDWVLADPIGRTRARKNSQYKDAEASRTPDHISIWMLQQFQVCLEPTEQLRDGYFMALLHDPESLKRLVTPEILEKMFSALGATPEAVDLSHVITPKSEDTERPIGRDHSNLCNVIDFLGESAPHVKTATREAAVCFLLRLCIDRTVVEDGEVQLCLGEAISNLVQSFSELQYKDSLQRIKTAIIKTVSHMSLAKQLLQLLPCLSTRLHMFRLALARAYFFGHPKISEQHSPIRSIKVFTNQLKREEYQVLPDSNYHELANHIAIFDIALDDGVPAYIFADDPGAEEVFNAEVDELAALVKYKSAQIRDNGALFMSRTAAKELLDRVYLRLVFSLRTKPAKKRAMFGSGIFGAEDEDAKKESNFMKNYLTSKWTEDDNARS